MMTFCGSLQYGPLHRTIDLTYHWTSGTGGTPTLVFYANNLVKCTLHCCR